MTDEVERGSDQINQEIMEKEGVDESVVTMSVVAEDEENQAEEARLERVAASEVEVPELGEDFPDPDEDPDDVGPEYDPLPDVPPEIPAS